MGEVSVKFLLAPLLIVGMFASFGAAVVAMLFYTNVVSTPQELAALLRPSEDTSRLAADLVDTEDELTRLAAMVEGYRQSYEAQLDSLNTERDSLATATAQVLELQANLQQQLATRQVADDRVASQLMQQQLNLLAPSFNKIKPDDAAAILSEGTVPDTLVALLMGELQPQQVARIMGEMDATYAAHITQLMGRVALP
jgi:flagellar motility protein MotE (MotC chaperone)